jgi:hypothetical protein
VVVIDPQGPPNSLGKWDGLCLTISRFAMPEIGMCVADLMAVHVFFMDNKSCEAVVVFVEANRKKDGTPYVFATFALSLPDGNVGGERLYRHGAEADALGRLKVRDVCELTFTTEQNGMRTFTRCTGYTPVKGKATLVIK